MPVVLVLGEMAGRPVVPASSYCSGRDGHELRRLMEHCSGIGVIGLVGRHTLPS